MSTANCASKHFEATLTITGSASTTLLISQRSQKVSKNLEAPSTKPGSRAIHQSGPPPAECHFDIRKSTSNKCPMPVLSRHTARALRHLHKFQPAGLTHTHINWCAAGKAPKECALGRRRLLPGAGSRSRLDQQRRAIPAPRLQPIASRSDRIFSTESRTPRRRARCRRPSRRGRALACARQG